MKNSTYSLDLRSKVYFHLSLDNGIVECEKKEQWGNVFAISPVPTQCIKWIAIVWKLCWAALFEFDNKIIRLLSSTFLWCSPLFCRVVHNFSSNWQKFIIEHQRWSLLGGSGGMPPPPGNFYILISQKQSFLNSEHKFPIMLTSSKSNHNFSILFV